MIRRWFPRLLGTASLLAVALLAMPALSRPAEDEDKPLGNIATDLALVPRDALYFVSARPADVAALPCYKAAVLAPPLEKGIDAMQNAWGFGPEGLERVTVFARHLVPNNPVLFVFRTKKAFDKDTLKKSLRLDRSAVIHGKTVLHGESWRWGPSLWVVDDQTFVIGQAAALVPYLATLAKVGKTHPLADELKVADGSHSLTAAMRPSLLFRNTAALIQYQEEAWRERRKPLRKEFAPPPPAFPKDKGKFSGLPREGHYVSYQPGFREEGRIEDLKDPDLKLKGLEEAFASLENKRRGPLEMFLLFKPPLRARRALATLDIGKAGELDLSLTSEFLNEEDAKDGAVMLDYGRITAREALTPSSQIQREAKVIAELLKPAAEAFRDAVVKRDGAKVTATVKAKPDLAAVVKAVMEGGPGLFSGRPTAPPTRPSTRPVPKFEPKK